MAAMRITAAAIILALLAPAWIAIANAPAAQCQLAPCCIGKSASCPMHHARPASHDPRMSCAPASAAADVVLPLAVFSRALTVIAPLRVARTFAANLALSDGGNAPLPHVPPPQRFS
jgi:hypothetical protein